MTSRLAEPRFSHLEVRAAARALTAGDFRSPRAVTPERANDLECPVGAAEPSPWIPPGRVIVVRPAHPGAGASSLALALGQAAASRTWTRLVDTAAPRWSALVAATTIELDIADGWRRGLRISGEVNGDPLVIDRPAAPIATPDRVPIPRHDSHEDLTVIDLGWTAREMHSDRLGWLLALGHCDPEGEAVDDAIPVVNLVVGRTTAHTLRQVETTMFGLPPSHTAVALVGARRRDTRALCGDAGHLLREASDRGVVHAVPLLRHRYELEAQPIPRRLALAGERLLDHLLDLTPCPATSGIPDSSSSQEI